MSASEGTHRTGLGPYPPAACVTLISPLNTSFSYVVTSLARAPNQFTGKARGLPERIEKRELPAK